MKKVLFILAAFLGISSAATHAQTITITNSSTCSGTVNLYVQAHDGSSSCPNFAFNATIDLSVSGIWGGSSWLPTDFNIPAPPAPPVPNAPVAWLSGNISTTPYTWDLAQMSWGSSSCAVNDGTGCVTLSNTASMTEFGCTVDVEWTKDLSGNVTLEFK